MTTAITTRKTAVFDTPYGNFHYTNLSRSSFFGYTLVPAGEYHFKIAEPEKALLDFFNASTISSIDELIGLRFNFNEIKERIDWVKLDKYLTVIGSKILIHRVNLLKKLHQEYAFHQ